MSHEHEFITLIAPNATVGQALIDSAVNEFGRPSMFPPLEECTQSTDGRFAWAYQAWPQGFLARAVQLGAHWVDYFDHEGTRWDSPTREDFTPKESR